MQARVHKYRTLTGLNTACIKFQFEGWDTLTYARDKTYLSDYIVFYVYSNADKCLPMQNGNGSGGMRWTNKINR